MAGEHRGGTVVVRVTADTKGFREQVERAARGIDDIRLDANFLPDTARLERTYREWNGKDATIHMRFEADTRGSDPVLRRWNEQAEALRRKFNYKPVLDDSRVNRSLKQLEARTEKVFAKGESFSKRLTPKKEDVLPNWLDKSVDEFRRKQYDLYKQVHGLLANSKNLSEQQRKQFADLTREAVKSSNRMRDLKQELGRQTAAYNELAEARRRAKKAGERTGDLWEQERVARKQITQTTKAVDREAKALAGLHARQADLIDVAAGGDGKQISKLTRKVAAFEKQIVSTSKSLGEYSKARDTALGRMSTQSSYGKWLRQQTVDGSAYVKDLIAKQKQAQLEREKLTQEANKGLNFNEVSGREGWNRQRRQAEELIETYRKVRETLSGDVAALKRNNSDWFDLDEYKKSVKALTEVDDRISRLKKNPVITEKVRLDGSQFQKDLADILAKNGNRLHYDARIKFYADNLKQVRRQMEQLKLDGVEVPVKLKARLRELKRQLAYNKARLEKDPNAVVRYDVQGNFEKVSSEIAKWKDQQVRIRMYLDGADAVRREMAEISHRRLDVPVRLQAEYAQVESAMRKYAAELKNNPDAEIPSELHINKKHAEEELKRFKEKNDTLDMDVDLETAMARAHLAYFTRPRTVDIFAKFHGTDLGRILGGMTYGASGLKGVENSFQNLVNLMDTLDKKVPRLAVVSTVLSDIGAGAINLAGTVGGLGKSIVSLSKAAYVLPTALTGMAAVYSTFKMIYGDKGTTWAENIDFTNTKLAELSSSVQKAFYGVAKPAIMETANLIGDSLVPEMSTLAKHEGEIVEGLMKAVQSSYDANELPAIFDRVNASMDNLVPGMESLITALSHVGMVGGKYLPQFAQWFSKDAEWFSKWAENVMNDSDRVDTAMSAVKEQAGYLGSSLRSLKGILEGAFTPLAQYQNGLEQFSTVLEKANRAVNSMSAQDTLNAWVTGARNAQKGVRDAFNDIGDAANEMRSDVAGVMANLGQLTGNFIADVSKLGAGTSGGILSFSENVRDGLSMVMSSISSASPMFSDLIRMAGQLSKTFGSTFANSLKAAAPTIEAIANMTSLVSEAVSKLPAPIQGMLGLWATFGRAGVSAWTALKTGALETIQNTMNYQNTLRQLGVTADSTRVKFTQLLAAMAQLERNNAAASLTGNAAMYGNVAGLFTSSAKGMNNMASEAENAATAVAKTGTEARLAAEGAVMLGSASASAAKGVGDVGSNVSPAKKALSGLKSVASDAGTVLLGMFGGPAGIALTAGLTIAGTAFSAYSQHVSKGKSEVESFNQAANATPMALSAQASSLDELKNRLDNFSSKTKETFGTSRDFFDKFKLGQVSAKDFDNVSDALARLNKNEDEAAKAASGSTKEYDKYIKSLEKIESAGIGSQTTTAGGITTVTTTLTEQAKAAQVTRESLEKLRKEQTEALQEKATAANKNADYVQTLLDEGQSYQSIADGLLSDTEKEERHTSVVSALSKELSSQRNATIQLAASSSAYYKTLEQVKTSIKQVQELHEQGQRIWDDQKRNFDLTTEAGRGASDVLTSLATSSNDYLTAMIAQGASADDVIAKQKELSDNFNSQARDAGVAEDAINGLNDSMLMTPKEIRTQVSVQALEAQKTLADIVESMSYLFPDKSREQTKTMLLTSVWNGKTDAEQLQKIVEQLTDGKHEIQFTADGTPVVVESDKITNILSQIPSLKETYLQARISGQSEADALKTTIEQVPELKETYLQAKADGKSDIDALKDAINSVPELKKAYAKAKAEGKDEVDALIDALKALPEEKKTKVKTEGAEESEKKLDDLEKKKVPAAKGVSFKIDADDNDANVKLAKYTSYNNVTLATAHAYVDGDDSGAQNAFNNTKSYDGVTLARPWGRVQGEHTLADLAFAAIQAFDNVTIARPWGRVMGENNDAQRAFRDTRAYDGMTISRPWGRVMGDDSHAQNVFNTIRKYDGTILATRYVDIVTRGGTSSRSGGDGSVSAATGGRIHGPGTATSDSIPAWLSTGEHVIRAYAVDKLDRTIGPNFLNVLNRTGDLDKAIAQARKSYRSSAYGLSRMAYASGGRVNGMMQQYKVEVMPNIIVPAPNGTTVNQTFNTKVVRSNDDLYAAAPILHRNALAEARRFQR